jgi:imidazoleglycerol-phosphate dehydratase
MSRTAIVDRNTAETNFHLKLVLDGSGQSDISTAVPFMDHMLTHVSRHGFFDLTVQGAGDTHIDDHHTVEDLGICLGKAFRMALADKSGIRRYGQGSMPMHEALVSVNIDFSGRPFLVYNVDIPKTKVGNFDAELVEEFCVAFCNHAGANLHVNLHYGSNLHHIIEAIFKALGRALDDATQLDPRVSGVLSTKGSLD